MDFLSFMSLKTMKGLVLPAGKGFIPRNVPVCFSFYRKRKVKWSVNTRPSSLTSKAARTFVRPEYDISFYSSDDWFTRFEKTVVFAFEVYFCYCTSLCVEKGKGSNKEYGRAKKRAPRVMDSLTWTGPLCTPLPPIPLKREWWGVT